MTQENTPYTDIDFLAADHALAHAELDGAGVPRKADGRFLSLASRVAYLRGMYASAQEVIGAIAGLYDQERR